MTAGCWELIDHACRKCFGRLVERILEDFRVEVMCVECGASVIGERHEACFCGVKIGAIGHVLECVRNPARSEQAPQQIVVRERIMEDKPPEYRPSRFVLVPSEYGF